MPFVACADDVSNAIERARSSLASSQPASGAWGDRLDLAATGLAAQGLRAAGRDPAAAAGALASVMPPDALGAAHVLLATRSAAHVAHLLSRPEDDHFYGATPAEKPSTTALAIIALALAGSSDPSAVSALATLQSADGSVGAGGAQETAMASMAFTLAGDASRAALANAWLLREQRPEGDWETPPATAWALLALQRGDAGESARTLGAEWLQRSLFRSGWGRRAGEEPDAASTGLCLWAACEASPSWAGRAAAVTWLQQASGTQGTWLRSELSLPVTSTVLDAFNAMGRQDSTTALAVLWLLQRRTNNVDHQSRRTSALGRFQNLGPTEISALVAQQDASGGWGVAPGFPPDVLDTALALDALEAGGYYDAEVLHRALTWLVAARTGPAWGLVAGEPAIPWATSLAMRALKRHRRIFDPGSAIADGSAWLAASAPWGDDSRRWERALALSAMMGTPIAAEPAGSELADFLADQQSDGSWQAQLPDGTWASDVFTTALVMRALVDSKPNLRIGDRDIEFPPSAPGVEGDSVSVTAWLENTGGRVVPSAVLRFYDGDPRMGGRVIASPPPLVDLEPGARRSVPADWDTTGLGGARQLHVVADPDDVVSEGSESDNHAVNVFRVSSKPDLAITRASITYTPEFPRFNEQITFVVAVRNLGETVSGPVTVQLFSAAGVEIPGDTSPTPIQPAATQPFYFRTMLALGSYDIHAVVDPSGTVDESSESNNEATLPLEMAARRDLQLVAVHLSDRTVPEGDDVQAWADVYNANVDQVTSTEVSFTLDGTPGSRDAFTTVTVGPIDGGRVASTPHVSLSTADRPGHHRIYAMADAGGALAETDETNNTQVATFDVSSFPDLTIGTDQIEFFAADGSSAPAPPGMDPLSGQPVPGESAASQQEFPRGAAVVMRAPISNAGATDATDVRGRFFLGNPAMGGVQIGEDFLVPIVRYKTGPSSGTDAGTYPWLTSYAYGLLDTTDLTDGDYQIYCEIDHPGDVFETDETNNIGMSRLTIGRGPDLLIEPGSLVISDAHPEEGDLVTVSGEMRNVTGTPVQRFHLRLYDGSPTAGGELVEDQFFDLLPREDVDTGEIVYDIPALGPNARRNFAFQWNTDLEIGAHALFAVLDPENAVPEVNETNNGASISATVVAATSPDFAVSQDELETEPPGAAIGDLVHVHATVRNLRRIASGDVRVRFLRVDPHLGQAPIGPDQVIASLGPMGSADLQADLDTTGLTGSQVVLVQADPDDAVSERDEINNVATKALRLRLPDAARALMVTTSVSGSKAFVDWQDPPGFTLAGYDVLRDGRPVPTGLEDLARGSAARVSSFTTQSVPGRVLTNGAAAAIDGNLLTYWQARTADTAWIELQLPKSGLVSTITLAWRQAPADYALQTWDGTAWQTSLDVTGNQDLTALHALDSPVETDRIRVVIPGGQPSGPPSLHEIRVHALRLVE